MVGAVVVLEWRCFGRGVSNQARGKNLINCASAVILSLSLSLSFPPSVNRTGLIFAMKIVPLVGKQCATPSRDSRENIFWSIGVSRNREPIKSNSGTKRFWGEGGGKTKRGWKGRRRGRKKEGEREKKREKYATRFFRGCKKHVFARGAAARAPIRWLHRADLHATFASRCSWICIRKGGARRFLPPPGPLLSLSLSCFRVSVSLSVSFPFCLPLSFTLASVQPPVYAFMGYWLSVSRR